MVSATTDRRLGLTGGKAYKTPATALATTNITLSGEQTVGAVAVLSSNAAGVADRVLCTGQTNTAQNGLWDVSTAAWTRPIDANGNYDLCDGTQVLITRGAGANQIWLLTTPDPITIDTTGQTWSQSLSAGFLATFAASSGAGLVGAGLIDYASGTVGAGLAITVSASGGDDTANWQAAVDFAGPRGLPVHIRHGAHAITTVSVGRYGCQLILDQGAIVTVNGNGVRRNLLQTPRATFIAANPLLDATNYYYTMSVTGGTFICGAADTAISDRVPFLGDTVTSPSRILLQRSLFVTDVNIMLTDATSIGIGIHGGWGSTVRGCTITAAGLDAAAIDIGGSSADGDASCHPQEILIDNVEFNSCAPFTTATNGCTNAAEALTVRGCIFNFVRLAALNNINSVRWIGGNLFVTDVKSLDIVDSTDVLISDAYFESNHDPDNSAKPGIVNIQNCPDTKVVNASFNVLATAVATARDGILIKANAANAMRGVLLSNLRFTHAAFNVTLETNAIRFATSGGSGQILDVTVRDIVCNDWHNAINFTDHITNLATGVFIENVANASGLRFLKGVARIFTNGLKAPGIYEQFGLVISGQSIGGGSASNVLTLFWSTVMRSAAPVVTVSNFVNVLNCNSIGATWAAAGANSVHIFGAQTAASAANSLVQGQATITVDGTAL